MTSDKTSRSTSPATYLLVAGGSMCTLVGQLLVFSANGGKWGSVVLAVAAGTLMVVALIAWWRARRRVRPDRTS